MTTLTVKLDFTLKELKEKYRAYFHLPVKEKVNKADIQLWLSNLLQDR